MLLFTLIVYKELRPQVFSFVFYCEDYYCLHVYYQHLNTQVHQNADVCGEVSHTYLLGCLRYGEKHGIYIVISCRYSYVVFYKHVTQL